MAVVTNGHSFDKVVPHVWYLCRDIWVAMSFPIVATARFCPMWNCCCSLWGERSCDILPDTHCVGSQEYVTFFHFLWISMATWLLMWGPGETRNQALRSFHRSLASGHGQSHWFLVRTLPPEFHYKDQAGQRLYSRLDPGRRWMLGQVYRALSDRHDHLERRFYAGRLFYRQLCVALW